MLIQLARMEPIDGRMDVAESTRIDLRTPSLRIFDHPFRVIACELPVVVVITMAIKRVLTLPNEIVIIPKNTSACFGELAEVWDNSYDLQLAPVGRESIQ